MKIKNHKKIIENLSELNIHKYIDEAVMFQLLYLSIIFNNKFIFKKHKKPNSRKIGKIL